MPILTTMCHTTDRTQICRSALVDLHHRVRLHRERRAGTMRSLDHNYDGPTATLVGAIDALAAHLAEHGEIRLAGVVTSTLHGDVERLPQRFLALFTHGMGGLLDVPLYKDGSVDRASTDERDRLAETAFEKAQGARSDADRCNPSRTADPRSSFCICDRACAGAPCRATCAGE